MDWTTFFDGPAAVEPTEHFPDGRIKTGALTVGNRRVPIVNGVPRFIGSDDYAGNFGLQWNTFRRTQLDSFTGLPLTRDRFWNNTKWKPDELRGKTVLEVGSGAGRFTEILLAAGATVVSFDMSSAVDANVESNGGKGDLFLMQASLYDIPLKDNFFDYVFCYGVLQHTPDPDKSFSILLSKARPGGLVAIDYYLKTKRLEPWSQPKYLWRPITTRMKPETLLAVLRAYIPLWLPIDTLIKKIPYLGNKIGTLTCIPCWNYHFLPLPKKAQVEWAIMDTFDALGAAYDTPKTLEEVRALVTRPGSTVLEVFYGSNGVVANVRKATSAAN